LITAVPAEVNCAVPITAESSQSVAVASQNVTVPNVTGAPFETVAVRITTDPELTDDEESPSVVVVVAACAEGKHTVEIRNIIKVAAERTYVWNLGTKEHDATGMTRTPEEGGSCTGGIPTLATGSNISSSLRKSSRHLRSRDV
jgi:hypothetical protein